MKIYIICGTTSDKEIWIVKAVSTKNRVEELVEKMNKLVKDLEKQRENINPGTKYYYEECELEGENYDRLDS
jgi:hypothetical protein